MQRQEKAQEGQEEAEEMKAAVVEKEPITFLDVCLFIFASPLMLILVAVGIFGGLVKECVCAGYRTFDEWNHGGKK